MTDPSVAAGLKRVAALLNLMERGTVAFVLCEDPRLQLQAAGELEAMLRRPIHQISLSPAATHPLELMDQAHVAAGDIVSFTGIEAAGEPALKHLEWGREAVWDRHLNLLFWVTGEGQRAFLDLAPNFYSRRSLLVHLTAAALRQAGLLFIHPLSSDEDIPIPPLAGLAPGLKFQTVEGGLAAEGDDLRQLMDAAVGLQRHLMAVHAAAKDGGVSVAIHWGRSRQTGGELGGRDVQHARALARLGSATQVLLSQAAVEALDARQDRASLYLHGRVRVSSTGPFEEVHELLWPGHEPHPLRDAPVPTNLPEPPPHFVGRRDLLEWLAAELRQGGRVVLTGAPGIGKSATALQAAWSALRAGRFPGSAVWLRASEQSSAEAATLAVAQALELPLPGITSDSIVRPMQALPEAASPNPIRDEVERYLRRFPALLVLDDLNGVPADAALLQWLRSLADSICILVTARSPHPSFSEAAEVVVPPLPEADARSLVAALIKQHQSRWTRGEMRRHVEMITALGDGSPVLLELAATATAETRPEVLRTTLEHAGSTGDTSLLETMLRLAINQFTPEARSVLAAALLFPAPFSRAAAEAVAAVRDARRGLRQLQMAGLLEREGTGRATQYRVAEILRKMDSDSLLGRDDETTRRKRYVEHYRSLVDACRRRGSAHLDRLIRNEWQNLLIACEFAEGGQYDLASDLGDDLAAFLKERGLFRDSERFARTRLRRALAERSQPAEASALTWLGLSLFGQARWSEAEPLMRRALAIHEASYGPDHPMVATDLNNLAQLLKATNRLVEAEPLMRRSLALDETTFGPDHPSVARDLNNLAILLMDTKRLVEAESLMRQALAIDEATYGPDDPNVARDLNNLALLLQDTNRLVEAEPLMRRALAMQEASYGPVHPTVAIDLNNLALLLQETSRLVEAEPLMRRALTIDEVTYGSDHPSVARDLSNLALLLQDTNRLVEADPLMRRAAEIRLRVLEREGYELPGLRATVHSYVAMLRESGRSAEEIETLLEDLKVPPALRSMQ